MSGPRLTGPRLTSPAGRLVRSISTATPAVSRSGAGPRLTGPRLTSPAAKLGRSISSTASASVPKSSTGTVLSASKATVPLTRKYADLLKERNIEWDSHPRSIYTRSSNRPHPAPRKARLMQTFTTAAPVDSQAVATLDYMVLPSAAAFDSAMQDASSGIRVPLLPDNFVASHVPETAEAPVLVPEINVVASNPELVSASALTEVEGMGIDGVELKFVHEGQATEKESGLLQDILKGLADDFLNSSSSKSGGKLAF